MDRAPLDITESTRDVAGFPYPDWESLATGIETTLVETEWSSAWEALARQWVDKLCCRLGEDYRPFETDNFLIVTEAPEHIIADSHRFFEKALAEIKRLLPGVAADEGYGKHVVLMIADLTDYYTYTGYFLPDGEHPQSGGTFLRGEGYAHFVVPTTDYGFFRSPFVHELTHACLAHLPLPLWLNEALAMRMEDEMCGLPLELDREIYEKHQALWDEDTIQQFWCGQSWDIPGDAFELSYSLARILLRKIEVDVQPPFEVLLRFIAKADMSDAGAEACAEELQLPLQDLVADFLGERDWEPRPETWFPGEQMAADTGATPNNSTFH